MFVRQQGSGWKVGSPAKLNLYLEVLGRRADGFHELETLMTRVGWGDTMWWRPTRDGRFSLRYHSATHPSFCKAAPADEGNLAYRAIVRVAEAVGKTARGEFVLLKRIPVGAGLGGGSSNAASAMALANHAWGLGLARAELALLGAELGSDVPFFFAKTAAVCRGRGERIEEVAGLSRLHAVVISPPAGLSTAEIFGRFASQQRLPVSKERSEVAVGELIAALRAGRIGVACRQMTNRLQEIAASVCPWVGRMEAALSKCDCLGHLLTGSGSSYFALTRSARQARGLASRLSSLDLGNIVATATCS